MINYFRKNTFKLAALIVASESLISQALRLGSNLILTRLLVPEMFGVMMIAMIFIVGANMLSDLGIREKYIQSDKIHIQDFINTCWSLQLIRGFVISFVIVLCGVSIYLMNFFDYINEDSVYSVKELPLIICLLALSSIFSGLNSPSLYDHHRNIRVMFLAKMRLISQLASTAVMLIIAYFYREVWVLLIAPILYSVMVTVISYTYNNTLNAAFEINKIHLVDILSFSKWIFIGSVISYIASNLDRLILGGYLNADMLGVFSIAFMMSMAVNELFSKIIKNVAYPKLTEELRNDRNNFKFNFYKLKQKVDLVAFLLSGFLCGFGGIIIFILYDDRYIEAGWMFEVLAISILFIGINVSQHALMALGKTFSFAFVNFIMVSYVAIVIPLAFNFMSVFWVIIFIALKPLLTVPFIYYLQYKSEILDIYKELSVLPFFIVGYLVGFYLKDFVVILVV